MPDESTPVESKRSNSDVLRSLIQTFSNDAQAVAKKKVGEQRPYEGWRSCNDKSGCGGPSLRSG